MLENAKSPGGNRCNGSMAHYSALSDETVEKLRFIRVTLIHHGALGKKQPIQIQYTTTEEVHCSIISTTQILT